MTDGMPDDADSAFASHDAFDEHPDGYAVTTTAFEGVVTASETDAEWATQFTVAVEVPTLDAATADAVGDAVSGGWLETLERRLEDAPKATRASVDLDEFDVVATDGTVTVTYTFTFGSAERAAEVAKTFVEYVEGTYVEGVIPGYDYESPVADLVESASQEGGGGGGTPL